jgi:4-hydroxy-tetrahydrodipicolinate synthase
MERKKFEGVFALLLTPFLENREIDWAIYDRYLDWQLSHQPHGVFAVCGSSEMAKLTLQERIALAKRAVDRAGDVPVIATANVGYDPSTHEQELVQIIETGVSGVVLIPPHGMGENQEKLGEYFAQMAEASSVPVFLYECPIVKPHLIDTNVYSKLAKQNSIMGIKDTTCTIEGIEGKILGAPEGIVYQANTPYMLESIHRGAGGIMAITSTAAVQFVLELWRLGIQHHSAADDVLTKLVFLDALLGKGFTATAKHLVSLQGIPMGVGTRTGGVMSLEVVKALELWHRHYV